MESQTLQSMFRKVNSISLCLSEPAFTSLWWSRTAWLNSKSGIQIVDFFFSRRPTHIVSFHIPRHWSHLPMSKTFVHKLVVTFSCSSNPAWCHLDEIGRWGELRWGDGEEYHVVQLASIVADALCCHSCACQAAP
jgi:hypothetical protein